MYSTVFKGFFIGDTGIYTRFIRPESEDKCPLVVILHGLPGTETNLDLAYYLREHGYGVLAPNYNGSWGSRGDYSIKNIPGNVKSVLNLIYEDNEFGQTYGIDTGRVAVVGHSVGGWATLISPKIEPRINGIVALDPMIDPLCGGNPSSTEMFSEESIAPLRGVTLEQIVDGLRWAAQEWPPIDAISELGDRFLMLLCATGSNAFPLEPALEIMKKTKGLNRSAEFWALGTDHDFCSCRPLVRKMVLDFLRKNL